MSEEFNWKTHTAYTQLHIVTYCNCTYCNCQGQNFCFKVRYQCLCASFVTFPTHLFPLHKLSGMEKIASFPAFQLFAAFLFDVFVN